MPGRYTIPVKVIQLDIPLDQPTMKVWFELNWGARLALPSPEGTPYWTFDNTEENRIQNALGAEYTLVIEAKGEVDLSVAQVMLGGHVIKGEA